MAEMCGKTKAVNGGLYIGAPHGDILCTVAIEWAGPGNCENTDCA